MSIYNILTFQRLRLSDDYSPERKLYDHTVNKKIEKIYNNNNNSFKKLRKKIFRKEMK